MVGVLIVVGGALLAIKIFAATRSSFADAMPPETAAFFHVDFLNLVRSGDVDRLLKAFEAENELGDPIEDAVSEIDRLLFLEDAQFDLTNDIIPWMGRGVGVGVTTFGLAGLEPEFIAAIDVRDSGEFRKFFPKLQATIEETNGPLLESEYRRVTIYTGSDMALALSKAVLLIGSNRSAIRDAIDAQLDESLADSPDFRGTLKRLPENRVLTGWINTSKYLDEFADDALELEVSNSWFNPVDLPDSYGFSGRFIDAGLRFDFAATYPDGSDFLDSWRDIELQTAKIAPDSTLGFLAAPPFVRQYLDLVRDGLAEEFDDFRRQGVEDYGIDLESDFLTLLDGEFGFIVTREDGGLFADESGVPVGLALFLGTSEQERLRNTLARFLDSIDKDTSGEVTNVEIVGPYGHPELYDVIGAYDDVAIPFGVDYGYLMVGTDRRTLEAMFAGDGNKLADDSTYRAVAAELDDMDHLFYVDWLKISDLLESMDPDDAPEFPRALESMLAGYRIDGNVHSGAFVIAIDY